MGRGVVGEAGAVAPAAAGASVGLSRRVPQWRQNRASSGFEVEHSGQIRGTSETIAPVLRGCLGAGAIRLVLTRMGF